MKTKLVHADQRPYLFSCLYIIAQVSISNHKPLAEFSGCTGRFVSYLVENPKDMFLAARLR